LTWAGAALAALALLLLAAIGALATIGFDPVVSVARFEYVTLGLALVGLGKNDEALAAVDEALLSLPGELEKRTAEQARAAEERRRLAETGQMRNVIAIGDATPDVITELNAIAILMNGTVQEQASARERLREVLTRLQPQQQAQQP
jgi:hypothetical protein